ncbi:MAG: DNA alkylation repair protein [Candidatus Moranbacteria bacterium]|nr:DNA alkylation repair protein [Candidatus Moranbacteria bacterium]
MNSKKVSAIRKEMRLLANKEKALVLAGFFKTGKGQYGEGDKFLGIVVPDTRPLVAKYRGIQMDDILFFLHSAFHEERLFALLVMVDQFQKGDEEKKEGIFNAYLANTEHINSWDLVDLTADRIVGSYLENRDKKILLSLAGSDLLWERRISILATFHFIKKGESQWTLRLAKKLLGDKHDLMHKAVGWMLREVGKRCGEEIECAFLDAHAAKMPRTALRYAIERFSEPKRQHYLALKQKI